MNILFVSPHSFERPGGVRTHILALSDIYQREGHKTEIIAPKVTKDKTDFNDIANLHEVGFAPSIPMTGTQVELAMFTRGEIKEIIKRGDFDVIHFHNFGPFVSTDAYTIGKKAKRITTFHLYPKGIANRIFTSQNMRMASKWFDHVIFVSNSQKKLFKDLDKEDYSIIPNGIHIDPEAKPRTINKDQIVRLLYVGRFEERKGVEYLVEAFRIISDKYGDKVELNIVGSGQKKYMDEILSKLGDNANVKLHGFLSDPDLLKLRKEVDISISPAYAGESFGIVLLESMSLGVPIVAFDNPGYKTVMTGKLETCLVESKNSKKLAAKIIELMENPELYAEISSYGIEHAKQYDWEIVAKKVMDVYKNA